MKTKFQLTPKIAARFLAAAVAGSTLAACSGPQPDATEGKVAPPPMQTENATTDKPMDEPMEKMASDKTAAPKKYRDVGGQIVTINAPAKNVAGAKTTLTLDHENIPDFMRAMRMTVPLQNAADAAKLKVGDKIRCDFVLENGSLVLANIRVLPRDTKLKLAPA